MSDHATRVFTAPEHQAFIDHYAPRAPRLTEVGYRVTTLRPDLHAWLVARSAATRLEPEHPLPETSRQNALLDGRWDPRAPPGTAPAPSRINRSDPSYHALLHALLPEHQRWAGIPLVPVQFFGPRMYLRHAVLARHVDHPATHVVSASITIAADLEEPWPMVLEGPDGAPVSIDLAPGQMLLYEGSRLPHYRPKPLAGERYVNLYLHYKPARGHFDETRGGWILPGDR